MMLDIRRVFGDETDNLLDSPNLKWNAESGPAENLVKVVVTLPLIITVDEFRRMTGPSE